MFNILNRLVLPLDDSNGRMTRRINSRNTLDESSLEHQMVQKGINKSTGDTKIKSN